MPRIDGEILQRMRHRDRVHKIAKRSGSGNDRDEYKKLRNMVTDKILTNKSEYFTSTIESSRSSNFKLSCE